MRANRMPKRRSLRSQRGIALFLCIFALLLVTGIVLAMLASSDTETAINMNYRETQVAYFAARGGLNEAVSRLKSGNIPAPTTMPSATGGVIYVLNKKSGTEAVEPWTLNSKFQDTELCKENFYSTVANNGIGVQCAAVPSGTYYTTYTSTSPFTGTAGALDFKWARITLKGNSTTFPYYTNNSNASATLTTQVCSDGSGQFLLPTTVASCDASPLNQEPVYVVTSLAVTPRGTRRMLQTEITRIKLPPLPGALTFNGPGSTLAPPYDAPNSNPFHIDGNDHGGCGGSNHYGVGSTDAATNAQIIGAIPSNRRDHYTGASCPDGSTPTADVCVVPNSELQRWDTPSEIEAMANQFKALANPANVYDGNQSDINIGSQTSPQITYVDGDLTMSGTTRGGGILIVTGTLSLAGNSGFYGIILAIGKGVIQVNGGGSGQFDGAVMVAHTRDNSGNILTSLGNPIVDWSGGGGNGIYYNQCAINSAQNNLGFKVSANRELMY